MTGRRRWLHVALLGAVLASPVFVRGWLHYGLSSLPFEVVSDVPGYADELRALPPYSAEVSAPSYRGPGRHPQRAGSGPLFIATLGWRDRVPMSRLIPRWVPAVAGLLVNCFYLHQVVVWDSRTAISTPVLTVMEADPGSGPSHSYSWSHDGRAVLIHGYGQVAPYRYPEALCFIYDAESTRLFRLASC